MTLRALGLLCLLTPFAIPASAQTASEAAVEARVDAYLAAWTFSDGIDFAAFEPIFMPGEDAIEVIDTFGDGVAYLRSYAEYVETWTPALAGIASLEAVAEDGVEVWVAEDFAVSTFILKAEGQTRDGGDMRLRQHATFLWEPGPSGDWRLVREHLTTIPPGD